MTVRVDLNADLGEGFGVWSLGDDEAMLGIVTSANLACGFHAGDPAALRRVCGQAGAAGVRIGAQVGYRDLAGFGRRYIDVAADDLVADVIYQIGALQALARSAGTAVTYVKPHGALYNVAARDRDVAQAIADGVKAWRGNDVILVGLAGSSMLDVFRQAGFPVWGEAFADRAYEADGTLRARSKAGALIEVPEAAAEQALRLAARGDVQTICVHSDTPGSTAIARAVRLAVDKLVK